MYFYCYDYVFSFYVYDWLPWLSFSVLFLSCKTNAMGKTRKDGARPALFLIFVLFYVLFVLCSMYCLFLSFSVLFVCTRFVQNVSRLTTVCEVEKAYGVLTLIVFNIVPFHSYTLHQTFLPLLETFCELLFRDV